VVYQHSFDRFDCNIIETIILLSHSTFRISCVDFLFLSSFLQFIFYGLRLWHAHLVLFFSSSGPVHRVMSLRDGRAKMSKSDAVDAARINLDDSLDQIASKVLFGCCHIIISVIAALCFHNLIMP
jgi:hypothetical protein